MRLPMKDGEIDLTETSKMVDAFPDAGFNYFDTAHGYLQGKSETALKACLTSRYPRSSYVLTDKLTANFFKTEADIRPCFEDQLNACRAYETAFALKAEGKVRHVGISFHDTPEMLERILTEYPQIEVVQIQFNYADYDDPAVQSRACYEIRQARHRHGAGQGRQSGQCCRRRRRLFWTRCTAAARQAMPCASPRASPAC